jgi:hypothetical protein
VRRTRTGVTVAALLAAVVAGVLGGWGASDKESKAANESRPANEARSSAKKPRPTVLRRLHQTGGFIANGSTRSGVRGAGANVRGSIRERRQEASLSQLLEASYALRAYPRTRVTFAQRQISNRAFRKLPLRLRRAQAPNATSKLRLTTSWRSIGPRVAIARPKDFAPGGDRPASVSGRVTAIATGSTCVPGNCRLWIGVAGGGVFRTADALARRPAWVSVSNGLTSTAIGALAVDPNDPSGRTLYAGTGESHSSADSEAGTGVFKTRNGGASWTLLPGSTGFAHDRAVTGIAIDPRNPRSVYVSTGRSIHGASAVSGGGMTPPSQLPLGVYQTTDGGTTFGQIFSRSVQVEGVTKTLSVTQLALDPNDPDTVYAAVVARGLFRRSAAVDGDEEFHQIFRTMGGSLDDPGRLQFALADLGGKTRIYLGDSAPQAPYETNNPGLAALFRVDDAARPAAQLSSRAGANVGWRRLSSRRPSDPGFDSFRYCGMFCWYANVVASPPGRPDTVVLASAFDYPGAANGANNGRSLLLSTDAGVHFTDLTADVASPPNFIHPDLHSLAFSPSNPNVVFAGGDGGIARTSGKYANSSPRCARRGLFGVQVAVCRRLLARVPTRVITLNRGLSTLLFQSVSTSPRGEILAGAQDNGTWAYTRAGGWQQVAGGDGGQSGFGRGPVRIHTYYYTAIEVNFHGGDPERWVAIDEPLRQENSNEISSFYMPLVVDARVSGTLFVGLQHVWRTKDYGGRPGALERTCGAGGVASFPTAPCGDWKPLGADLTGYGFGVDRSGEFVVAIARGPDRKTLWAATLAGRVFVSQNADAAPRRVRFKRVDLRSVGDRKGTPERFVSSIVVDPKDANHAWISYSGYDAYTPTDQAGHVFEVRFDPASGKAKWRNRSYDLGDQPLTGLARDHLTGDLYASTDFGVVRLPAGAKAWTEAAPGLPIVAVFGLTMSNDGRTLYAATHGRGAWALRLR